MRSLTSLTLSELNRLNRDPIIKWEIRIAKNPDGIYIRGALRDNDKFVASGRLTSFPLAMGGPIVSTGLYVPLDMRGQGFSKKYDTLIKSIAEFLENGRLIASVSSKNTVQTNRLKTLGWDERAPGVWYWESELFEDSFRA